MTLAGGLQRVLLLGHELETGERVAAGDAVALGHLAGHLGGDDGLEEVGIFRHLARPAHGADQVIQQQHAGLVAGDGDELAVRAADHNAHTVAVRVGAQDEVRTHLVGQLDGQIEALRVLRIGGGHRGKRAVQHHLLLYAVQVLHTQAAQGLRHQLPAAAVEGGVYHLEAVGYLGDGGTVIDHSHDVGHEHLVRLLTQKGDKTGLHRVVKGHALHAGEDVDLLQTGGDGGGVLGRQLRAVGPVDLVAVVFLGVMAGGDVDARLAAVVPHGEAQLRRGAQGLENTHADAIGGADLRRGTGEGHAVHAAVHADGHTFLFGLIALGGDNVGKALGGPADDVYVHLVQTHLHGAPQSGGTEFQRAVEPALDLLLVPGDGLQFGLFVGVQRVAGQPTLVFPLIVQHIQKLLSGVFFRFLVLHRPGGQQVLCLLQLRFGHIQAGAVAGKAVDDLSRAAIQIVILEAGDAVGRQQGDDHIRVGGRIEGLHQQHGLLVLPLRVLGPRGDVRLSGEIPVVHSLPPICGILSRRRSGMPGRAAPAA